MLPNSPVSVVGVLKDKLQSTEGFIAISCRPHLMLGTVERDIHVPFPTYFTLHSLSVTPPSLVFSETLVCKLDNWK